MNTFGSIYRLTDFGESHGSAMGGIIDGVPSGIVLDLDEIQKEVNTRSPGVSTLVTQRKESDKVEFLSGITADGVTLGTPIGFIIRNVDARPADYSELKDIYRPGHADYTYQLRYGIRDYRGGGRASARETVCRMVAGAVAIQILRKKGVTIHSYVSAIGKEVNTGSDGLTAAMRKLVEECRRNGDSVGGRVKITITGMPGGVGNPVFGKLQSRLAEAMMSINAVRCFQYGAGYNASESYGSEMLCFPDGILGGISTGLPIEMEIAFKPTPTLGVDVPARNSKGEMVTLRAKGRHDPCVAIRGCHVARAMAAMTILDILLIHKASTL